MKNTKSKRKHVRSIPTLAPWSTRIGQNPYWGVLVVSAPVLITG